MEVWMKKLWNLFANLFRKEECNIMTDNKLLKLYTIKNSSNGLEILQFILKEYEDLFF